MSKPTKCTGITKAGNPCTRSARPNTNPPRCYQHVDQDQPPPKRRKRPGAPKGNQNAVKHGLHRRPDETASTLKEQIEDLERKYNTASRYIDEEDLDLDQYLKATTLLSQLATRIARLQEKLAKEEGADTGKPGQMKQALGIIWEHLGIEDSDNADQHH